MNPPNSNNPAEAKPQGGVTHYKSPAEDANKDKVYNLNYLAELLLANNMLDAEQRKEIMIKGESQRARMSKKMAEDNVMRTPGRRSIQVNSYVSPAEVIASYEFVMPVNGKVLSEDYMTQLVANDSGYDYVKIDPLKLDVDVVTKNIPRAFAQKNLVIPINKVNNELILAICDPYNLFEINEFIRTAHIKAQLVIASKTDIMRIVKEFYGFHMSVSEATKDMTGSVDLLNLEQFVKLGEHEELDGTDQHVVNAVEYILKYAYDQKASDIHIEPKRENTEVRIRVDGTLHLIHKIPKEVHPAIVSRIKMLGRMDISERRKPQDGRIKTNYNDKDIELRLSTMPTAFGEKFVIRIFDPGQGFQKVGELGFRERELFLMKSYLQKTFGIILVTGPTGSGKTTTLYSCLRTITSPEINIVTIEDPIEMVQEHLNQVSVNPMIDLTFASALRTILRQDPDVIMVGEIRDTETANNAIQAALTGHLVFSTLHTNDAPSSIARLIDLGVPKFLVASSILGILAQRLVKRICEECKTERLLTRDEKRILRMTGEEDVTVYYGKGCVDCRNTGYQGRMGIHELMHMSEDLRDLLAETSETSKIRNLAKSEGMTMLRDAGVAAMLKGETTYEEVVSVTD